jgi:hypothetical protein
VPEVVFDYQRIECSNEPVVGALLIQSPGLYMFVWDNSFSWFREKYLRFRISVLKPDRPTVSTSLSPRGPIALQGEDDDVFVNPQGDILEVGVEIKGTAVGLRSQHESEDLLLESIEELPLRLAAFIDRICDPNLLYHKKIGVVENTFQSHYELGDLGSIAVARDVEAVALLSYHSLHPHTLVAVVLEPPLRSSVIHRGRLLTYEDGSSLGDISRLPEKDPVRAVANQMMVFGPATIIVIGLQGQFVDFSDKVKEIVPESIWQPSVLKESSIGNRVIPEAASKLHFLRTITSTPSEPTA